MVLNGLLIVLALAELVVAVRSAVLCCGAVCSCCKDESSEQSVQYNAVPVAYSQQDPFADPARTSVPVSPTRQPYSMPSQSVSCKCIFSQMLA